MKESSLKSDKIRSGVCLVTAFAFSLFIAYHCFLLAVIETSRIGRILGLVSYVLMVAASILGMISRSPYIQIGSVLMIAGLSYNFIIRLFNATVILGSFNYAYTPSVLNAAVYLLQQLAILILLVYYLVFRHNPRFKDKRSFVIILMTAVIALYVGCFAMECVLALKYRVNIDVGRWVTVCSRVLYCLGFVSIAVRFMLPVPKSESQEDVGNPEQEDDDFLFSAPDEDRTPVKRDKSAPVVDDEFLFSLPDEDRAPVKKDKKAPVVDDEFLFSLPDEDRAPVKRDVSAPVVDDEFLFSLPDEDRAPVKRDTDVPANSDFMFLVPDGGKKHKHKKPKNHKPKDKSAPGEENKDFIL